MSQEKLQILNMVKEGKISPEEAVELLNALGEDTQEIKFAQVDRKCLRIRVFDPEDDTKVNVTIPASLLRIGVKFASKFSPEFKEAGLSQGDVDEILQAVDSGEIGKIIEVDSDDGTKVEISIE